MLFEILLFFFFFNDTATTEIYTLSLHDALPISSGLRVHPEVERPLLTAGVGRPAGVLVEQLLQPPFQLGAVRGREPQPQPGADRKSTRLNSSHANISYAVFCLKKKKQINI